MDKIVGSGRGGKSSREVGAARAGASDDNDAIDDNECIVCVYIYIYIYRERERDRDLIFK